MSLDFVDFDLCNLWGMGAGFLKCLNSSDDSWCHDFEYHLYPGSDPDLQSPPPELWLCDIFLV